MLAFRQTESLGTIPGSYRVIGAPDVEVHELICAPCAEASIPGLRELA